MSRCDACGQGRVENTGPTTPPRCDVCGFSPIPLVMGGQGRSAEELRATAERLLKVASWLLVACWLGFLAWLFIRVLDIAGGAR